MFRILKEYSSEYKLILHFHSIFNIYFNLFIPLLIPAARVIVSHHGGVPPDTNKLEDKVKKILYKISFKNLKAVTYLSNRTKNFINYNSQSIDSYFLPVGADFDFFTPIDKKVARKKFRLDPEKVYAIYVGNFYKLKSVDLILEIYRKLRNKYNFSVIFVGGKDNSINDMYHQVVNSGCPYYGNQPWEKLKYLYGAADFYIHPAFNPQFGGIDVAWMEALACNVPVMSSTLSILDFDYKDIGILLKSKNEIYKKTEFMINNFTKFKNCREIAKRYLDGKSSIIEKLYKIYMKALK